MPYIDDFWCVPARARLRLRLARCARGACACCARADAALWWWVVCGRPKFQLFSHARPLIDIATDAEISVRARARVTARVSVVAAVVM
jgi:hypothetical protein